MPPSAHDSSSPAAQIASLMRALCFSKRFWNKENSKILFLHSKKIDDEFSLLRCIQAKNLWTGEMKNPLETPPGTIRRILWETMWWDSWLYISFFHICTFFTCTPPWKKPHIHDPPYHTCAPWHASGCCRKVRVVPGLWEGPKLYIY